MPKFVEIDVHFTRVERALIQSIAEEGMTLATYVKRLALCAARSDLREAAKTRSPESPN